MQLDAKSYKCKPEIALTSFDPEPAKDLSDPKKEELPNFTQIIRKKIIVPTESDTSNFDEYFSKQLSQDSPENFNEDIDFVNSSNLQVHDFILVVFDYNAPYHKTKFSLAKSQI